jgi:ATP-dependent Clp protease protease subunit
MKKDDDSFGAEDKIKLSLLENSTFFLTGEIAEENVGECIKWLTYENFDDEIKTLTIYINSYGGDVYQAFALIDAIKMNKHVVKIVATGAAMSAAFLILSAGTPGYRYATALTGLMTHQFSSDSDSLKYHDLKSTMKELDWINERMYNILKSTTGLDGRTVKRKLLAESDVYFKAEDLLKYGVIDHVI